LQIVMVVNPQNNRKHAQCLKSMVLSSINIIDAGEKSNFSTAALRQRKLGSHSAYASEGGPPPAPPSSYYKDI
jgi:hypothetical protein